MTKLAGDGTADAVRRALLRCLATDPRTQEPMNALVAWTELGKGLSGTLDDVGAERGLLRKLICAYGIEHGHGDEIDLARWGYRLAPERRLDPEATADALRRAEAKLSEVLAEHLEQASRSPDARRALFVAVVKGWFPVGLDIMRALPAGNAASEAALIGALAAWCERHLPTGEPDAAAPAVASGTDGKVRLRVLDSTDETRSG